MAELVVERRSAFARLISSLPASGDIRVSDRCGAGLVMIASSGGENSEAEIEAVLGLRLPDGARGVFAKSVLMIGTGPGTWLASHENAPSDWSAELSGRLAGCAAVIDQSSGYARLRLEGEAAWRLLGKGAFIDLHPQVFTPGSVAVTLIAHMGAILWRRPDCDAYEVACFRSHAASFWHWLFAAAEGEGLSLAG